MRYRENFSTGPYLSCSNLLSGSRSTGVIYNYSCRPLSVAQHRDEPRDKTPLRESRVNNTVMVCALEKDNEL